MESCVDVRCLDNGPTPTYVDAGLPRIDSHDCVRRRTLTCVNVRWRRTLPRLLNAHECSIVLRRRTSAYVVLVAVLRWRRTTLVLGIVLGLSEKNGSPTTQKSYDSVWPRLKELISQLQKRQNHAARVITKWRKYDHITPVLVDLHWLPVKQRIDFKILLLTYKALNGLTPAYMRELLIPYSPKRTLRSMENHLLTPPRCRLEYFGKRSFAAAAPTLWNNLPLNIKQAPSVDIFKSRIKTHLFQLAYFM